MPEPQWNDKTVMPWGAHKGKKLSELPASYLLWLYEQPWVKGSWPLLYAYLKKNEDLLLAEKNEDRQDDEDDPRSWEDYQNYR
jgi:hypothetical protein